MAELSVGNPVLHEYYNNHTTLIDISHIQSEDEITTIRNIIIFSCNNTNAKGNIFYSDFIQPFKYTLARYDNTGIIPYFIKQYYAKNSCLKRASRIALRYIKETNIKGQILHEHIIYIKNVPIAKERLGTHSIKTLNFKKIKDPFNQSMIEKWAISLLMESSLALATISSKLQSLINIMNRYEKNCRLWTDDDIRACFNDILEMPVTETTKQNRISTVTNFFTFLTEHNYILTSSAWLLATETKIKIIQNYKKTAPDEFLLSQMFNALKHADDLIKLVFLIF